MSKLKLGMIPQGTECPFKSNCEFAKNNACHHLGVNHGCDYSCASARWYDMTEKYTKSS